MATQSSGAGAGAETLCKTEEAGKDRSSTLKLKLLERRAITRDLVRRKVRFAVCIDDQTRTVNYLLTKSLDLLGAYNYNQFRQFRHDSESSEPVNL